jgi:hypothetical protein
MILDTEWTQIQKRQASRESSEQIQTVSAQRAPHLKLPPTLLLASYTCGLDGMEAAPHST